MSFQLYVGNYPSEFSRKDVADIFQEFDGIQVHKFFKKEKKSYSFLICKDIDQVVSVVQHMNNATVSGRKLIVRASDENLQEYVTLLLQETSDDIKTSRKTVADINETPRKYNDANGKKFPQRKSYVESPPFVPLQAQRNKTPFRKAWEKSTYDQFEINSSNSSSSSLYNNSYKHNNIDAAHCSEFETASVKSSNSNNSLSRKYDDFSEFVWVSVTNFPLGTSIRSIYGLFSDYEPLRVKIICNEARRDKTLTEAHVCFLNRDIADDVIFNFDNTMFNGRLLLVNDIEDLTIMNELLSVVS